MGCKIEKPSAARKISGGGAGARRGSVDDASSRDCCCNIQNETSESESCQVAAIEGEESAEDDDDCELSIDDNPER